MWFLRLQGEALVGISVKSVHKLNIYGFDSVLVDCFLVCCWLCLKCCSSVAVYGAAVAFKDWRSSCKDWMTLKFA